MTVRVLLQFEDEIQAKKLVEEALLLRSEVMGTDSIPVLPYVVCGVWKAPTLFCDPSDGHRGKKTQSGWTRGKKYGWWVCAKCGKPSRIKKLSAMEWESALGTNLLPPQLSPEQFQYRKAGWESPVQWNWLLEKLGVQDEEVSDGKNSEEPLVSIDGDTI